MFAVRTRTLLTITAAAVAVSVPAAQAGAETQAPVPKLSAKQLKKGSKGADVSTLQELLGRVGLPVAVTGEYADKTVAAVKRFQFAARLPVTGTADRTTIASVRSAARGPRNVEASGGLNYGSKGKRATRLGQRIPLVPGMSGRDIRELQDYLRRAHIDGAPKPDGAYADPTRIAVKRFEAKSKRPVDGSLDAGDLYELRTLVGDSAAEGQDGDPAGGDEPARLAPGDRARLGSDGLAIAPENAPEAVKRVIAAGNRIAKTPYKWGGGHGRWIDSGYDCSGSVSYALRGGGLIKASAPSYGYYNYGEAGAGKWITIYTNAGHMYMTVAGLRFDTSGRGNSGSRWQKAMRSNSGFKVRHPAGY
jgi:peptidoglycan hydrolase-like protein with peptidoglycan-binding domain